MLNFKHSALGVEVDLRRMGLSVSDQDHPLVLKAAEDMHQLEAGAIANPTEGRRVGHYWLRTPALAPDGLGAQIEADLQAMGDFARTVVEEGVFQTLLLLGIGGSALGPQLLVDALSTDDGLGFVTVDNTDPESMWRTLNGLDLSTTLVLVVSKSGSTAETRNALRMTQTAFQRAGLNFPSNAVAVTVAGSKLDSEATENQWLARFPQYDWVGGRTSVCSAVGVLPAALLGFDFHAFLSGCAEMDAWCRESAWNPASAMAMAWYRNAQDGGRKNMVFLPYKDRLALMGRYLQQLIMESIGKTLEDGEEVHHFGLTVFGNKGSTDQHALVQQLREGEDDFFAAFVAVLDKQDDAVPVEGERTAGDYLLAMLLGTRKALTDAGRKSYTIVLDTVDARRLGALIALHERAVGVYASMLGINAYDQPGVEAGKRCAEDFLLAMDRYRSTGELQEGPDAELLGAWLAQD